MLRLNVKIETLLAVALMYAAMVFAQPGAHFERPVSRVEIVRVIHDRQVGVDWALVRDSRNPGGPGRMVPMNPGESAQPFSSAAKGQVTFDRLFFMDSPALPVIRNGDRIVIEEHSAVVDARLEATALGTAAVGNALSARLMVGGKVVRVTALASGRAAFALSSGAQQ